MTTETIKNLIAAFEAAPGVVAATEKLEAAQQAHAEAKAARDALGYPEAGTIPPPTLRKLTADDDLDKTAEAVAASRKILATAEHMAEVRFRNTWKECHTAHLRDALVAAQAVLASLTEDLAERNAVNHALGYAAADEHPIDAARHLRAVLEVFLARLDRPAAPPVPPVPAGFSRVKVLTTFRDGKGTRRYQADERIGCEGIEIITDPDAEEAISKKWAVPA